MLQQCKLSCHVCVPCTDSQCERKETVRQGVLLLLGLLLCCCARVCRGAALTSSLPLQPNSLLVLVDATTPSQASIQLCFSKTVGQCTVGAPGHRPPPLGRAGLLASGQRAGRAFRAVCKWRARADPLPLALGGLRHG